MGFVYIMSNPSFPNWVKIGKSKNPKKRRIALSSTASPHPFRIEFSIESPHYNELEKKTQIYLARYRINKKREFFETDVKTAKNCIIEIAELLKNDLKYLPMRLISDEDLFALESRWNSDYDRL